MYSTFEVSPLKGFSLVLLLWVGPLTAQERPAPAANPLAQLKDEVKRVLADAALPFAVYSGGYFATDWIRIIP